MRRTWADAPFGDGDDQAAKRRGRRRGPGPFWGLAGRGIAGGVAQRKSLSEMQVGVLRWIGDGCPVGVMDGESCRISAAALRRRGLVTTAGRGPSWTASITEAGREYLARCDGPNPPVPRQANGSVTEQLVNDVVAAGGSLRLPRTSYGRPGHVDYEQRARMAERFGKVPSGKRLVVHHLPGAEVRIDLVDGPETAVLPLRPVPVPRRVTQPHPVVVAFRTAADTLDVSRAAVPRAARILQALTVEAERRGHKVAAPGPANDSRGSRWASSDAGSGDGVVAISVDGHTCEVKLSEEGLQSRGYWEQRNRSYRHRPGGGGEWVTPPRSQYEANATGRLTLTLVTGYSSSGRQQSWSDRTRWTLDEKLPEVLLEIETRAVEARERKREKERQAAERQRAWEQAMERARSLFLEEHRAKALADQADRWQRANTIRAYCAAAESTHPDSTETAEWVAWARSYGDRIDPLQQPPQRPPDPERISPDDLKPFLGRWNPYRPDNW